MLIGTWHLFCESEKVSRNTNSYQRIMKTGVPFFMFWTQVTEKKKKEPVHNTDSNCKRVLRQGDKKTKLNSALTLFPNNGWYKHLN